MAWISLPWFCESALENAARGLREELVDGGLPPLVPNLHKPPSRDPRVRRFPHVLLLPFWVRISGHRSTQARADPKPRRTLALA